MMRRLIRKSLQPMGFTKIIEADDGVGALNLFLEDQKTNKTKDQIGLIISDWLMKKMNGIEFLKEIRKINKKVPFLMITVEGTKQNVIDAIKFGVTDYVVKPFTPKLLEERVRHTLTKKK